MKVAVNVVSLTGENTRGFAVLTTVPDAFAQPAKMYPSAAVAVSTSFKKCLCCPSSTTLPIGAFVPICGRMSFCTLYATLYTLVSSTAITVVSLITLTVSVGSVPSTLPTASVHSTR